MPARRNWLCSVTAFVAGVLVTGGIAQYWHAASAHRLLATPTPADPAAALAALRDGNSRYVRSVRVLSTDTVHDAQHRRETAQGQHPFAALVCCADSRLVPEFIFDQHEGSIFEIRNAGNVVDEDVMASLEYAVEHFHVPLVVILGHKGCGAIKAVCEAGDHPMQYHLFDIQKHMEAIRKQLAISHERITPELLDQLARENARQQALTLLRECPVLEQAVKSGQTRLLYAIYDMLTGAVDFFELP